MDTVYSDSVIFIITAVSNGANITDGSMDWQQAPVRSSEFASEYLPMQAATCGLPNI